MLVQPGLRAVNLQKVRLLDRLANANPKLANEIRNTKLEWFRIKNVATEADDSDSPEIEAAEVYIYDEIGGSFGVGATDFIDQINEIDAPAITVRINSPGGLLIDAIAMASALQQHPAHVTTRVDGIAASAASIIACAGDTCEMMNGSQLMIHRVMAGAQGNVDDMREMVDWLNHQDMNVATMYAKRANNGSTPEEWLDRMKAETWMFADEAVELGLMDSVYTKLKDAFPPKKEQEGEPAPDEEEEEEAAPEEEDMPEDATEEDVINSLMTMRHRLTNRGYRYLGRNKAPAPSNSALSADEIEMFIRKIGRK